MRRLVAFLVATAVVLSDRVAAGDYVEPEEPLYPRTSRDCSTLAGKYFKIRQQLSRKYSATPGRGAQVASGPCCAKEAASGNSAWCRTYENVASIWEDIHCLDIKQRQAVDRCVARLRTSSTDAGRPRAKGSSPQIELAKDYLQAVGRISEHPELFGSDVSWAHSIGPLVREADSWYRKARAIPDLLHYRDLLTRYRSQGLPSTEVPNLVDKAVSRGAQFAITDPVVRDIVTENLYHVGVLNQSVIGLFDRAIADIRDSEPSARPRPSTPVIPPVTPSPPSRPTAQGPSAPAPSAPPMISAPSCKREYYESIADCVRGAQDYATQMQQCRRQLEPRFRHCI